MSTEWPTATIESVCTRVTTGGTPSRRRPDFFENGTIPWFKTGELRDRLLDDSQEHITTEALESSSAKIFPIHTVLMAMYGDGDTITNLGVLLRPAATNQACCAMIVNSSVCNWRYLFYALKHTRAALLRIVVGGAQRNLSGTIIRQHQFPLPPLREQQAIACILGALDDKIELNRRRNRTLEAMARAIFQSWFVDFAPVKAKVAGHKPAGLSKEIAALFPASFEDSPLGPIPADWLACRWGDIATLEYGKSLRDYANADGTHRVFGTNGPIGWHTETLCSGPGIVIGRKGAYRGIHYSPKPFFVIDTAFYLKPKRPIDFKWAYYELLRCDINGMDSGSAIPSTSRSDFYAIPVCLPSPEILEVYGARTQPVYDRRDLIEVENSTLAGLRDTLLPKLISGELRVPDAERIVGRAV